MSITGADSRPRGRRLATFCLEERVFSCTALQMSSSSDLCAEEGKSDSIHAHESRLAGGREHHYWEDVIFLGSHIPRGVRQVFTWA
jgi:hypothetical protein